jgi:hypothetical protein
VIGKFRLFVSPLACILLMSRIDLPMWVSNERADILAYEGSISGALFQNQAGLTIVNTSDIHTRARTRLLTEWQESWNDSENGSLLLFYSTEGFCRGMDGSHGRRKGLFGGDV